MQIFLLQKHIQNNQLLQNIFSINQIILSISS